LFSNYRTPSVPRLTSQGSKRDKFVDILPQTQSYDAYMAAKQIRENMGQVIHSGGTMWDTPVQCDVSVLCDAKLWDNRNRLHSYVTTSNTPAPAIESREKPGILRVVNILLAILYARDHYTCGHSIRTSEYAAAIGESLGFSPERLFMLRTAALLHDIGKICIPGTILNKAIPLTEEEWRIVHNHPTLGASILKSIDGVTHYLPGIRHHHEHYDGSGYPSGLEGNNIPLDARIISIADACDAMTSPRCYRKKALTFKETAQELEYNAGTQFDPELVGVFINIMRQPSRMPVEITYAE